MFVDLQDEDCSVTKGTGFPWVLSVSEAWPPNLKQMEQRAQNNLTLSAADKVEGNPAVAARAKIRVGFHNFKDGCDGKMRNGFLCTTFPI